MYLSIKISILYKLYAIKYSVIFKKSSETLPSSRKCSLDFKNRNQTCLIGGGKSTFSSLSALPALPPFRLSALPPD
jgi:hypothetical protein